MGFVFGPGFVVMFFAFFRICKNLANEKRASCLVLCVHICSCVLVSISGSVKGCFITCDRGISYVYTHLFSSVLLTLYPIGYF